MNIKRLTIAAACAAVLTAPTAAFAFEYVEVGAGITGQGGAVFLDKPGDQLLPVGGQDVEVRPEYPGFAGAAGGIGGMIDVRFMKYVGLEIDFIHQWDFGKAELTITDIPTNQTTRFDVEIGNKALHIPLLFKGVIPGEIASPMLFVGPEFVVPVSDAVAEVQNQTGSVPINTSYSGLNGNYINVMFGLGMEVNLPIDSDVVSVRIPLNLRGAINPGVSDLRTERANHVTNENPDDPSLVSVEYKTDWKFAAYVNLGVAAYF